MGSTLVSQVFSYKPENWTMAHGAGEKVWGLPRSLGLVLPSLKN